MKWQGELHCIYRLSETSVEELISLSIIMDAIIWHISIYGYYGTIMGKFIS